MTTRINKYLVGALLCPIINSSYAMDDAKKGIDLIEPEDIRDFAKAVQKVINDTSKNKSIDNYKIDTNTGKKSLREALTPLINSDKVEEIEKALSEILQLTTDDYDVISKNAQKWNAMTTLLTGVKIGDTELKNIKKMAKETLDTIQDALNKKKEYEKYLYITDDTQTMAFLEKKEHAPVKNEKAMLWDKQSNIKIQYKDKKKDLKNAIITISDTTIPTERLEKILESEKDNYIFFKKDENDSIRKYMAKELAKGKPTTARANELLAELHQTEIGAENDAGDAIRTYLQLAQNYQDKVKARYIKYKRVLPEKCDLDKALKEINNDLGITEDEYTNGYKTDAEVLKQLAAMKKDYNIEINSTRIADHKWNTKQPDQQMTQIKQKYLPDILFQRLKEKTNEYKTLKTQYDNDTKKLTEAEKEKTDLTKTKTDLEAQIKLKETAIKQATDEKQKISDELTKIKENNTKLQEKIDELTDTNTEYDNYATSLLNILNLSAGADLSETFGKIEDEVKNIQAGGPKEGASKEELQKRDEEINTLREQINLLEAEAKKAPKGDNKKLSDEITKLMKANSDKDAKIQALQKQVEEAQKMSKGEKGAGLTATELDKILQDMLDNAKENNPRKTAIKDIAKQIKVKYLNTINIPKEN